MAGIADPVKIISTSMVAPATPSKGHRMFLSNLDLLWLPEDKVPRLLFYRISTQDEFSSIVEKLRESLSSVLVYFYPLAGRIDKGSAGRVEIHCNDEGVQFVEASIDIPFEDAQKDDFHHKPFFQNLVSMPRPLHQHNYSAPLLSVQVTAFGGGGGICVGTTFHHVVADGNSIWHFMKSWSECSRGLPISDPPLHNRTFFKIQNKTPLTNISLSVEEIANDRITGAKFLKYVTVHDAQPEENDTEKREESLRKWQEYGRDAVYSTFHFTEEMIRKLKERSRAKSSFVAVTSHFWRCVMRAREVPLEETVNFNLLVDCRGRVKPPLPPTYFGNCVCPRFLQTSAEKLECEDGVFAAEVIEELIKYCSAEVEINNMIEWVESLESPERGLFGLIREAMKHPGTNVVSSPRFPVYEVDFGWGRPLNVQAASVNVGGMVLFGEREGRGIAVTTRLPQHEMQSLKRLLSLG